MRTKDFDYELPAELIAQHPLPGRSDARMMVVHRDTEAFEHKTVSDLPSYLRSGDLLVLNDTRLLPARVEGVKAETGGRVDVLFVEETDSQQWDALCHASRRPAKGCVLRLADGLITARVVEDGGSDGLVRLHVETQRPLLELLEEAGESPLPPYIKRPTGPAGADRERYQTVYARTPGAIAAPTAGLHFTAELLGQLEARGVRHTMVTLHVGIGTFKPVKSENVEDHVMASERYVVGEEAALLIEQTKAAGGRVVAVGSTSVRSLETVALEHKSVVSCSGRTELFIRPPFEWQTVDAMLTNFHLPKSTLIMMVSALAGTELTRRAYREAIVHSYRFYSYGDCMLIL